MHMPVVIKLCCRTECDVLTKIALTFHLSPQHMVIGLLSPCRSVTGSDFTSSAGHWRDWLGIGLGSSSLDVTKQN